jgi:hypothetical protein
MGSGLQDGKLMERGALREDPYEGGRGVKLTRWQVDGGNKGSTGGDIL